MSQVSSNGVYNQEESTSPAPNDNTPSLPTRLEDSSQYSKFRSQHKKNDTLRTVSDGDDSGSDGDDDDGLTCPICHCVMIDPFITKCGHSYCHACITRHLDKQKWCPICRGYLQDSETCPNFDLNKVIEQHMAKPKSRSRRNHANLKALTNYLDTLPYTEDVLAILNNARAKRKKVLLNEETVQSSLLSTFLSMVEDHAVQKATKWKQYQDLAFQDKLVLQQLHPSALASGRRTQNDDDDSESDENNEDYHGHDNDANALIDHYNCHGNNDGNNDGDNGGTNDDKLHYSATSGNSITRKTRKRKYIGSNQNTKTRLTTSKELELALARRRNRINPHFSSLMDFYFTERQKPFHHLSKFSSTLYQLTLYSQWAPLDTIYYTDLSTTSSIVSSIEFDCNEDYFAVAGVNKEIKFYDYNMLNDRLDERPIVTPSHDADQKSNIQDSSILPHINHGSSIGETRLAPSLVHCPLSIIPCGHKISCLSWNPYIKSRIASSDYDGVVNIWDANTGQNIRAYEEHRQRAWSVDTCTSNPLMMASASDDACVKIWSIHEKNSLLTLAQRGNVCCAKFAPSNQHLLAVGSADHRITCYDLRNTNNPLQVFSGHNKAVSYVKWNSDDEITSASTDNTLKLWQMGTNECIRTYSGHRNEKNFVGLSLKDNWISCGSENNAVYTYHKNSSQPVAQYKFSSMDPIAGQELQNEDTFFVSSVCWKKDSMKLLASNSKGVIKLLQLVE